MHVTADTMSSKLVDIGIPLAAMAASAAVIFAFYKNDPDFRKSIDQLMGWSSVDDSGCCGGTVSGNCCQNVQSSCGVKNSGCCEEESAECCGGADENGGCCGDNDGGCCDNNDGGCCDEAGGDRGCGDGLEGHVLTTPAVPTNDLEDMHFDGDFDAERPNRSLVSKRRSRHATSADGFLPPLYVKTFGCSHNTSDSEFMAGILAAHGYPLVDNLEACALIVVNSCTVKNPSQDAFVNLVRRARQMGKKVVVAGCVPQADREELPDVSDVSAIGVAQLERILEVVEETLNGNTIRLLGRRKPEAGANRDSEQAVLPSLDLPKVRRNKVVEIIPLSTGCLGACTYCKTKHARGKLGSYHPDQILRRVESVLDEDAVSEIWMTSEDTGAYGLDLKRGKYAPPTLGGDENHQWKGERKQTSVVETEIQNADDEDMDGGDATANATANFEDRGAVQRYSPSNSITDIADLLLRVTTLTAARPSARVGGSVMLRLGMTNPPYMLAHKEALAHVLNLPNVFAFLHIPVQSGSDAVLDGMFREYTRADFEELVDYLRANVPNITLATDIICGFPGESEDDHEQTLDLLRKYKFVAVNISQFYPRAGTAAAKMRRVDTKIVKRRSTEVTKLFESYTTNEWLQDKVVDCWFNDTAENSDHTVGHTKEYIKVLVPRDDSLIGKKRRVLVTKATGLKWHVEAELAAPDDI